jgi:hypothetical protein
MDEQASFEARAVLPPRRARRTRVALLVPVVALIAVAGAGVSGARSEPAIAGPAGTSAAIPVASLPVQAAKPSRPPARALGFDVQRLVDVQRRVIARGEVIAVSGWYVATAITGCPPLDAIYRAADAPRVGVEWDSWAFCDRSGILFATQPNDAVVARQLAVPVRVVPGVRMPPELQIIGRDATQVVVIAHFVEPSDGCATRSRCPDNLVVDYVAWTSTADG